MRVNTMNFNNSEKEVLERFLNEILTSINDGWTEASLFEYNSLKSSIDKLKGLK
jgi:hypothetical protein